MGTHIKRDGRFLCNPKHLMKREKYNFIHFSKMCKLNALKGFCGGCLKRYYEILSKLEEPIIIND